MAGFGDDPMRFEKKRRKTECPASNLTLGESLVGRRTSGQSAELVELERELVRRPVLEQEQELERPPAPEGPSSVAWAVGVEAAGAASAAAGADGAFAAEQATWV